MGNQYNPHKTIQPDDLEELTGEPKTVWYDRIWETMRERDYCFVYSRGRDSTGGSHLHLPAEFPDDDLDAEPNEVVEHREGLIHCRDLAEIDSWKYKPPAMIPPGYRDVCTYCLHDYVHWYDPDCLEAPAPDDILRGGVHG